MRLKVLYVTPAQSRIIPMKPKGNRVSMDGESCKVTREHMYPKGAPFDAIWVQGHSEAVPVEKASPVTSWEFDSAAETDLLHQVHGLAQGPKEGKASWVSIGLQGAVLLAIIVVAVVLSGNITDLEILLRQLHSGAGAGGDSTVYRPGGG